jgi:hypothetical protein
VIQVRCVGAAGGGWRPSWRTSALQYRRHTRSGRIRASSGCPSAQIRPPRRHDCRRQRCTPWVCCEPESRPASPSRLPGLFRCTPAPRR